MQMAHCRTHIYDGRRIHMLAFTMKFLLSLHRLCWGRVRLSGGIVIERSACMSWAQTRCCGGGVRCPSFSLAAGPTTGHRVLDAPRTPAEGPGAARAVRGVVPGTPRAFLLTQRDIRGDPGRGLNTRLRPQPGVPTFNDSDPGGFASRPPQPLPAPP